MISTNSYEFDYTAYTSPQPFFECINIKPPSLPIPCTKSPHYCAILFFDIMKVLENDIVDIIHCSPKFALVGGLIRIMLSVNIDN